MKDKVINIMKVFILLFAMTMGFFFLYAIIWFCIDLPITKWTTVFLMILAGLSEYGYFRWIVVEE